MSNPPHNRIFHFMVPYALLPPSPGSQVPHGQQVRLVANGIFQVIAVQGVSASIASEPPHLNFTEIRLSEDTKGAYSGLSQLPCLYKAIGKLHGVPELRDKIDNQDPEMFVHVPVLALHYATPPSPEFPLPDAVFEEALCNCIQDKPLYPTDPSLAPSLRARMNRMTALWHQLPRDIQTSLLEEAFAAPPEKWALADRIDRAQKQPIDQLSANEANGLVRASVERGFCGDLQFLCRPPLLSLLTLENKIALAPWLAAHGYVETSLQLIATLPDHEQPSSLLDSWIHLSASPLLPNIPFREQRWRNLETIARAIERHPRVSSRLIEAALSRLITRKLYHPLRATLPILRDKVSHSGWIRLLYQPIQDGSLHAVANDLMRATLPHAPPALGPRVAVTMLFTLFGKPNYGPTERSLADQIARKYTDEIFPFPIIQTLLSERKGRQVADLLEVGPIAAKLSPAAAQLLLADAIRARSSSALDALLNKAAPALNSERLASLLPVLAQQSEFNTPKQESVAAMFSLVAQHSRNHPIAESVWASVFDSILSNPQGDPAPLLHPLVISVPPPSLFSAPRIALCVARLAEQKQYQTLKQLLRLPQAQYLSATDLVSLFRRVAMDLQESPNPPQEAIEALEAALALNKLQTHADLGHAAFWIGRIQSAPLSDRFFAFPTVLERLALPQFINDGGDRRFSGPALGAILIALQKTGADNQFLFQILENSNAYHIPIAHIRSLLLPNPPLPLNEERARFASRVLLLATARRELTAADLNTLFEEAVEHLSFQNIEAVRNYGTHLLILYAKRERDPAKRALQYLKGLKATLLDAAIAAQQHYPSNAFPAGETRTSLIAFAREGNLPALRFLHEHASSVIDRETISEAIAIASRANHQLVRRFLEESLNEQAPAKRQRLQ